MLWLTSTLSILSRLISRFRRSMNRLVDDSHVVTSVSVVQRWNQRRRPVKAGSPATAANAKQTNIRASAATKRHGTRNSTATIHAAIAGRRTSSAVGRIQHPFAGLQDFIDITSHTPTLGVVSLCFLAERSGLIFLV